MPQANTADQCAHGLLLTTLVVVLLPGQRVNEATDSRFSDRVRMLVPTRT